MKSHFLPDHLEYVILPGRNVDPHYLPYYNGLYELWKTGWQKTFEELHSSSRTHASEFLRQSLVTGIFFKATPIAFHSYSFFEFSNLAHLELPYFHPFLKKAIPALRNRKFEKAMTIEYLYVAPGWRKETLGIGLSSILISLGLRIFERSDAEVGLGVTRNDRGMNDITYPKGAECLEKNIPLHSVSVDLVYFQKSRIIENLVDEDRLWFESFWNRRIDTTHLTDEGASRWVK